MPPRWLYLGRLSRWVAILATIRGAAWQDEVKLLVSALASPALSLRRLQQWEDPRLLFDVEVVVKSIGKFALRRCSDDLWHVLPSREKAVLAEIQSRLRPGDTFVDAGANLGLFTVVASRLVGSEGRVVAIEMMPETAARLRTHVRLNRLSNVAIRECALSDQSGRQVVARVPAGSWGQASIQRQEFGVPVRLATVATATLDDVLKDAKEIRLLKMDLEGSEFQAARGGSSALRRTEAVIFEDLAGSPKPVEDLMGKLGLDVLPLDARNWLAQRGD